MHFNSFFLNFHCNKVQYENPLESMELNEVSTFQVGDIVTIDTNGNKVEKLQKGHEYVFY